MLTESNNEPRARFIDFAHHGGCSQKLPATRLRGLLQPLLNTWSDAGFAEVGNELTASSVDVVLPMIDDSALFGRIVTNHVLSDLYAVGVEPVFALNILGVPDGLRGAEGLASSEIDAQIQEMLLAAGAALQEAGAVSVGGHTLSFDVLFFGMAATGVARQGRIVSMDMAMPGDRLVLTKPVGTSIATKAWKIGSAEPRDAGDVLEGMLRSNRAASIAMLDLTRCGCTDISGFGLLGHLHNMLEASGASATISVGDVPVYPSAMVAAADDSPTRIFDSNRASLDGHLVGSERLTLATELFLMDAQISGGLLIALPPADVGGFMAAVEASGEQVWEIGELDDRSGALINLG